MKLFTRIKISYAVVCVVPVLLICVVAYIIGLVSVNSIEKQYDIANSGLEVLYNPLKVLNRMTHSVSTELDKVIAEEPEQLENSEYLEQVDNRLNAYSSFLIVKRGETVMYTGAPDDDAAQVEDISLDIEVGEGNVFVPGSVPYHIKQKNFTYADGAAGKLLIVTNIAELTPRLRLTILECLFVMVLILLLAGMLLTMWLYKSIVKPIGVLKVATENIKDGNLNFSVQMETKDEIGELCYAFEEMRKKLKEQIEVSMQYEKENKELISNISHDLKTPITAIKGYIEGIQDGVADTPEKVDRYLKTIYTKANDMQSLIEELFLYSKLDSNTVTYNFAKINLNDYFEDCIEEISLDLETRNIDVGLFNYADKDVMVIADPEQLKRVIMNIINNSAKYIGNKKGLINVRIHEEAEFIQVELEDNGKGIAKADLSRIFERCYRTDASRNSAQGGSGLGLSIARKIIEEHGGRIWAASRENTGTSICFVLRKYEERNFHE